MRSERNEERWYMAEFMRIKGELLRLEDTPEGEARGNGSFGARLLRPAAGSSLVGIADVDKPCAAAPGARTNHGGSGCPRPVLSRFKEGFQTADLKAAKALIAALS